MLKEGKIFGKINILDFLFLIVLIMLLFLAFLKATGKEIEEIGSTAEIKEVYVVATTIINEDEWLGTGYLDSIKEGDRLGATKQYIDAFVEKVELLPVKEVNMDINGNPVESVNPSKEQLRIEFRGKLPFEKNVLKFGDEELRQGKIVFIQSDAFRYKAMIDSIEEVK